MKKGDLVVVSTGDWPHDVIHGVYRVQTSGEALKVRYDHCRHVKACNIQRTWIDTMIAEGLFERVPIANLWLGESWQPATWNLSEPGEW